jgi:dTDP-4-dehydrorhamnose 3,5-epimerase
MKLLETTLADVLLIETDRFADERGYFAEQYHHDKYATLGLDAEFVQDNHSYSHRGVLRGLHFQWPNPQGKLVQCLQGEIFDVAVDIRTNSPDFGKWFGTVLSNENGQQLYIPEGFAHGFLVLSDSALVHYKCTRVWDRACDAGVHPQDPELAITWPGEIRTVSAKDAELPLLSQIEARLLPTR